MFYIKETQAKQGYFLNTQRFDVTVKAGDTQTINVTNEPVPTIVTKATSQSGKKESFARETHLETATMGNLIVGQTYKAVATQYNPETDDVLGRQEKTFKATQTTEVLTFEFTVPVGYTGDIVYGEELYKGKEKVAVHVDLKNKEQTVRVRVASVQIEKTNASNGQLLSGIAFGLYHADTNQLVKKAVTDDKGWAEFTLDDDTIAYYIREMSTKFGYFPNTQRFDVTAKQGQTQKMAVTNEPVPTIETVATGQKGGKEAFGYETHFEKAIMTNLVIGQTYKAVATQYNPETAKVLGSQERTFKATQTTEVLTFEFTVPVGYTGDIVYGETLYRNGEKVAVHFDLKNKKQTVTVKVPKVVTEATTEKGEKTGYTFEKHREVFTAHDLIVGRKYLAIAFQYGFDGKILAKQEREFVAKATTHQEIFLFDVPTAYVGQVVYGEELYEDGKKVAVHFDLKNEKQTVKVLRPTIQTLAKAGEQKEMMIGTKTTLTDTLTYDNHKNGEVMVKTWVVKRGTDEMISTPLETIVTLDGSGSITILLTNIDTSRLPVGEYTIMEQVFEVVEKDGKKVKGNLISEHVDNKDDKQTITVKEKPQPVRPELPKTGTEVSVIASVFGVLSMGVGAFIFKRKK